MNAQVKNARSAKRETGTVQNDVDFFRAIGDGLVNRFGPLEAQIIAQVHVFSIPEQKLIAIKKILDSIPDLAKDHDVVILVRQSVR